MRNILVSGRKAEEYLKKSVEVARQIGAIGILGQASLGLGQLYKTRGKTDEAKKYFSEAIEAFEKSGGRVPETGAGGACGMRGVIRSSPFRHQRIRAIGDQLARRPSPSAISETTRVFKLTPSFSALAASLA